MYGGIVESVKKYVTLVTIKNPFRIVYVDIMKTEDAAKIMEINEKDALVVSSGVRFCHRLRRYPLRIRPHRANLTPGAGPIYEHTQRVRTIRLLLSALLLKAFL